MIVYKRKPEYDFMARHLAVDDMLWIDIVKGILDSGLSMIKRQVDSNSKI